MKQCWKPGNMLYPVPVVMVSCARPGEKPNIITVAWTGTVCSDPVMVSVSVRKDRYSHAILSETGEFVINLVPAELAAACDTCGVKSGRDTDKFALCGLHTEKAQTLKAAPLIRESPLSLECRVERVLELGSHDLFLARVTAVNVEEELLTEKGALDLSRAELIAYSHGEYFRLGEKLGRFGFSVRRKKSRRAKA